MVTQLLPAGRRWPGRCPGVARSRSRLRPLPPAYELRPGQSSASAPCKRDRLARSVKDLQDNVHELKARGIKLKATEQPIDTGTAAGKAFLDMLGVFAEFETNLCKERQLEGDRRGPGARMRVTTSVSPSRRNSIRTCSSVRPSRRVPLTFSARMHTKLPASGSTAAQWCPSRTIRPGARGRAELVRPRAGGW